MPWALQVCPVSSPSPWRCTAGIMGLIALRMPRVIPAIQEGTQCLRTGIGGMGYLGYIPSCQTGLCHGGITAMGNPDRNPWITEPNCEQCHGNNYSTGGDLYRHAKGHGGIYCAACHNSPHAWWPSKLWVDNLQPSNLQHAPASIGNCSVCHTSKQSGDNPHVTYYPATDAKGK